MKDLDLKVPTIRNPIGKIKIDADSITRKIYDYNDDSFDFIDTGDE
jgi:hypothetical protein